MTLVAVVAAMASAVGFSLSTSLEHRAAGSTTRASAWRLIGRLVAQPLWVLGAVLGGVAFVLHAVAVGHGPLALVQPIVVSGVVLAIPVRAALGRQVLSREELAWAAVAACGLALFIVAARPSAGISRADTGAAVWVVVVGSVLAVALGWGCRRIGTARQRGLLLGVSAGVLFGLVAGLLKLAVADLRYDGVTGVLTDWPVWVLVPIGVGGVALNQRAYQEAPLSVSMPVLNITDIVVAIGFGLVVFAEVPAHSPVLAAAQVAGLVLAGVGVWRLMGRAAEREVQGEAGAPAMPPGRPR